MYKVSNRSTVKISCMENIGSITLTNNGNILHKTFSLMDATGDWKVKSPQYKVPPPSIIFRADLLNYANSDKKSSLV